MDSRSWALLGVPSSAAAHWPGQEKAPQALREAGLLSALDEAGVDVVDAGDTTRRRGRPDGGNPQNLDAVVAGLVEVSDRVADLVGQGRRPFVVGGECSVELGVLAGHLRQRDDVALLYFDGGVDLRTPADNPTGVIDSMVVAHALDRPGAHPRLAGIGPRVPLLDPGAIVFFGYNDNPGPEDAALAELVSARFPCAQVAADPSGAAELALSALERAAADFVVHLDIDVIDFTDLALADVPQIHAGLSLEQAMAALRVFLSSPHCLGLTLTEINPDHGDEAGGDLRRLVAALADAFPASEALTVPRREGAR
jgi:arginase